MAEEDEQAKEKVSSETKTLQMISAENLPMYMTVEKACSVTGFKEHFIRKLCKTGAVDYKDIGKKFYINTQSLLDCCMHEKSLNNG